MRFLRASTLRTLLTACVLLGCTASMRYPGWEHVRIESDVPPRDCEYRIQEACPSTATEGCLNWYKKRATKFGANVVVLTHGRQLADYYTCDESSPGEQDAADTPVRVLQRSVSSIRHPA